MFQYASKHVEQSPSSSGSLSPVRKHIGSHTNSEKKAIEKYLKKLHTNNNNAWNREKLIHNTDGN